MNFVIHSLFRTYVRGSIQKIYGKILILINAKDLGIWYKMSIFAA